MDGVRCEGGVVGTILSCRLDPIRSGASVPPVKQACAVWGAFCAHRGTGVSHAARDVSIEVWGTQ